MGQTEKLSLLAPKSSSKSTLAYPRMPIHPKMSPTGELAAWKSLRLQIAYKMKLSREIGIHCKQKIDPKSI